MENDLLPEIHYDQLIIVKEMIPYDDLAINGDYGRHLIIPDDVLNTLSHLVVRHKEKPKIATMDDDGGVNVHVVNQSGGSGGIGKFTPKLSTLGLFSYDLAGGTQSLDMSGFGISTLYSASFIAAMDGGTAPAGDSIGIVHYELIGGTAPFGLDLCLLALGGIDGAGKLIGGSAQANMNFVPPLDIAGSIGSSPLHLSINGNAPGPHLYTTFSMICG